MKKKTLAEGRKPGSGTNPKSNRDRVTNGVSAPSPRLVKQWDDAMIGIPEPGAMLSIEDTAAIINSIPEEKKMQRLNRFVLAVTRLGAGSDKRDVEDLRKRFYAYIQLADLCGMKVGNMQAYAAMGVGRLTLEEWFYKKSGTPEQQELAQEVRATCTAYREMLSQEGQINPVTAIFYHKNHDGFRDQIDYVQQKDDPLGQKLSNEQIAKKYEDIIEE